MIDILLVTILLLVIIIIILNYLILVQIKKHKEFIKKLKLKNWPVILQMLFDMWSHSYLVLGPVLFAPKKLPRDKRLLSLALMYRVFWWILMIVLVFEIIVLFQK